MEKKPWLLIAAVSAVFLCTTGCLIDSDLGEDPENSVERSSSLFVFETDYQSAMIEAVNVDSGSVVTLGIPVNSDAVVKTYGGYIYVLERFGADNIMKIDPSKSGNDAVVYQYHLEDNANPYDVSFISPTKAYIVNQNTPEITIFNPERHEKTGTIALNSYIYMPDSNSSPYANRMVQINTTVYLSLQRRNGFAPGAPTLIVPIATESDYVMKNDTIRCRYANNNDMVAVDDVLYCTNPGNGSKTGDGGIERIDCATGEVTTVITEDELGGSPFQIVHKGGNRFYVQLYIGWTDVKVVEIDAAEGTVVATVPDIQDAFGGICYDTERKILYVGERGDSGIGILMFKDNVKVAGPLKSSASLPPGCMTLVDMTE